MRSKIDPETFSGLSISSATVVFEQLVALYLGDRRISESEFKRFRKRNYSPKGHNRRFYYAHQLRAFFYTFENGKQLLRDFVHLENQRRKAKRSLSAYDDATPSHQRKRQTKARIRKALGLGAADLAAIKSELALIDQLIERRKRLNELRDAS